MERADTDVVSEETAAGPGTVRRRVRDAVGSESFVAAVRRRTEGTPSYPEVSETRFETAADLPAAPFDPTAMRSELTVFTEVGVYRWVAAGGTVERTRLPRGPNEV